MDALDPELLAILVCPLSRKPLVQRGDWLLSTDPETRRRYRIEDGIPVLLVEEGEEMGVEDWREAMRAAGVAVGNGDA
ncbi:MAG: Trm112 family protein [Planctomycetota bacterium]